MSPNNADAETMMDGTYAIARIWVDVAPPGGVSATNANKMGNVICKANLTSLGNQTMGATRN